MKGFQIPRKINRRFYFLDIPFFLSSIFIILFLVWFVLDIWLKQYSPVVLPFIASSEAKMPVIETEFVPDISATGAIIMDADSKAVLYFKNPNLRFSTASTIKIMTAMVSLDYFKLSDILNVNNPLTDGSVLGLVQNEKMTFENLSLRDAFAFGQRCCINNRR